VNADHQHRYTPYFQPIVSLDSGKVIGFETLLRIVGMDGSVSGPGSAVEKIEQDATLLDDMLRTILNSANTSIAPLFDRYPGFYLSINIPPIALGTGHIARMIAELDMTHHLDRFVIELTERQALTDPGRQALQLGRQYGIRVAVDDFGTGYSGLPQIAGLDLDMLKIDRSLVEPALANRSSARLIRGIVALAQALHMHTIAEGVETWEQAFFLKAAGVDCGQGFFWSKAVPAQEVEQLLRADFSDRLNPRS